MSVPASALERELQLKSDALEHSLNGFDIVDAQGRFVYANRAYLDMWGFDRLDEVIGTSPAEHCVDPSVPGRIIGELKTRGECVLEFLARRKDGSTFDVRMWARVAHDSDGQEIYPTTSIDITEEKRAARTARVLSEATDALISELELEAALHRVARVIVPELADACVVDLLPPSDAAPLDAVVVWHHVPLKRTRLQERRASPPVSSSLTGGASAVIRTGQPELRSRLGHGDLSDFSGLGVCSSMSVPLRARGRTLGALTLLIDDGPRRFDERDLKMARLLSDRVALAVDNALLYRSAQEAVRSREEFISVCSHELKTPVAAMKLQFQTAQRQIDQEDPRVFEKERVAARIDNVLRQVGRMSKLIEDMLDVSRFATGRLALQFEPVELGGLVREVVERFGEQAAVMEVSMSLDRPPDPVEVSGDRLRLEQVVTNLLTNALKYGEGNPVSLTVRQEGGAAVLVVQDRGIGIAPEDTGRIFQRFERIASTANVGGLGLGLYITREIVDAHGGQIQVESTEGAGTAFVVRLPLADSSRA